MTDLRAIPHLHRWPYQTFYQAIKSIERVIAECSKYVSIACKYFRKSLFDMISKGSSGQPEGCVWGFHLSVFISHVRIEHYLGITCDE